MIKCHRFQDQVFKILVIVSILIVMSMPVVNGFIAWIMRFDQVVESSSPDFPYNTTVYIDSSNYPVEVVGEDIGSREGKPFSGWYTDTIAYDPETGTIAIAWARKNEYSKDFIYLAILKPIDADGDEKVDSYQRITRHVANYSSNKLESLDSITMANNMILVTWTYYRNDEKLNVAGALFSIDGELLWNGNITATKYWEEYSRSCFVPEYNNGDGGFLIIWYRDNDDKRIYGKWLYKNGGEWDLSDEFEITYTGLYYFRADQMLCIGGNDKALVVYRKWKGRPVLYAALVDTGNNVDEIDLLDNGDAEETVGVRGAYVKKEDEEGYFIVPFISGTSVGYVVVSEDEGTVEKRYEVTSNGEHPYAIALEDRFVLAWIDYQDDETGQPRIANIDLNSFNAYVANIIDPDGCYDMHPLIAPYYDGSELKLLYVWSSSADGDVYDVKYAIIEPNDDPDSAPSVVETNVLVLGMGDQRAHGIGSGGGGFVVVYTDNSDGEEDLLAYVVAPDADPVSNIKLYLLPQDGDSFKQDILDAISSADRKVYVAMAFFREDNVGGEGSISKALVNAYENGVDVKVILDNSTDNQEIYNYLSDKGVPVINDSSAPLYDSIEPIMHNKFIVIDGSKVIVSTANLVHDDIYYNNNTALLIESEGIAYFFENEFLQMWNNGDGLFSRDKTMDYSFIVFAEYDDRVVVFEGLFGPQSMGDRKAIPNTIYGYISHASEKVYFASYIFTTSSKVKDIYKGLVDASKRGLEVVGVFDETMNLDTSRKRIYWFIDNASSIESLKIVFDNHPYKMHAKLFVVDDSVAIISSWNPTLSATLVHDEYVLIIKDPGQDSIAAQLSNYIWSMYSSDLFVKEPYVYTPSHPIIHRVMFMPDDSGEPWLEWIEILNPTASDISLKDYIVGDAENLIKGDNEGMYSFPENAVLYGGSSIIIAYSAREFYQHYGFKPDYEIAGTDPDVPDLEPYDPSKFTGTWDLDDSGDEVILGIDRNGFIVVVDAIWYGNSGYIQGPESGKPLDISGFSPGTVIDSWIDAVEMNSRCGGFSMPPSPEPLAGGLAVGLGGYAEPYIQYDVLVATISIVVLYMVSKKYRIGRRIKGISMLVATAIIVSVAVAIAIVFAFWVIGSMAPYEKIERLEIVSSYSIWVEEENVWIVVLHISNKGSSATTIDAVLVNGRDIDSYRTLDLGSVGVRYGSHTPRESDIFLSTNRYNRVSPATPDHRGLYACLRYFNRMDRYQGVSLGAGSDITIAFIIPGPGYTAETEFSHGLSIEVKLHTASGQEYFRMVNLV